MREETTFAQYKAGLRQALGDEFLKQVLDAFASSYPVSRKKVFAHTDLPAVLADIAKAKDEAIARMDELFAAFKEKAEAAGARVHLAKSAGEANALVADIARQAGVKSVVKSKSMTSEETRLNHHLEAEGFTVVETDLGEWIIQLRGEGPSHMVMPAIHLSRGQVADLFTKHTGKKQSDDIERLVKVARRELRSAFASADMGITGANFALADTGTLGIVTNEGNARLTTTLPRVHVALVGLDKLLPRLSDALNILKVLPGNATGQTLTSYVTWITGAVPCETGPEGRKELHIVFLDNGRSALAKDPDFSQVLRCVRCGACANVCPVYRQVGGHEFGHIYIGAIGFLLTYFMHGRDKAQFLVRNCIGCEACRDVCAASIDLPRLIKEVRSRTLVRDGRPLENALLDRVMSDRRLFHGLLRTARRAQKPIKEKNGFLRHLPLAFFKEHDFRALPALADTPFRDLWPRLPKDERPEGIRVGFFSGCVQDFVYPEQAEAGTALMRRFGARVSFPMGQSCCGLPLLMMGEKDAARRVALQNVAAMDPGAHDRIVTMCASCASHIKNAYPRLLADDPDMAVSAAMLADKVTDFSTMLRDVLGVDAKDFPQGPAVKTAYHAPCHLCRGLGVHAAPHELLDAAGLGPARYDEEEVCCGFGGSYSLHFPEVSARVLSVKLDKVMRTGADILATDCPGCVLQLRGGARKQGLGLEVLHTAELLLRRL